MVHCLLMIMCHDIYAGYLAMNILSFSVKLVLRRSLLIRLNSKDITLFNPKGSKLSRALYLLSRPILQVYTYRAGLLEKK
jgi:hypothetical protein